MFLNWRYWGQKGARVESSGGVSVLGGGVSSQGVSRSRRSREAAETQRLLRSATDWDSNLGHVSFLVLYSHVHSLAQIFVKFMQPGSLLERVHNTNFSYFPFP